MLSMVSSMVLRALSPILGGDIRQTENGRVQSYMIGFFGGAAVLTVIVIVLVTFVKG